MEENYREIYDQEYVDKYSDKEGEGRIEGILQNIELNTEMDVLDVGCGNGFLANIIKDKVKTYIGIDVSEAFVDDAKKRVVAGNCEFRQIELSEFVTKTKNKFDLIFLLDVTEHIPDHDLIVIFECIKSLLKPKGKLVIHTPNLDYFLERLKDWGVLSQVTGHIAVRNFTSYQTLLRKTGYMNSNVIYINHYNKLLKNLFFLRKIPFIGNLFRPRLLIIAE